MQHISVGRAQLAEAPSPCGPGPPGFSHSLLFYPGENAGANPAGKSRSLWFTQSGSPTLWWWVQRGNTGGSTMSPSASLGAEWDAQGSSTLWWRLHQVLASCAAFSLLGRVQGESQVGLDESRPRPGVTHPGAHLGCRIWPGQGMLLSPCSSLVTNPFHPPGPTVSHPVGFLPSPAWGCRKVWHSGGQNPELTGWLSSPQQGSRLLPAGATGHAGSPPRWCPHSTGPGRRWSGLPPSLERSEVV